MVESAFLLIKPIPRCHPGGEIGKGRTLACLSGSRAAARRPGSRSRATLIAFLVTEPSRDCHKARTRSR
jgi:hypothetical protein